MFEPNIGLYTCGDQRFHSKVRAWLLGQQINRPVEWWFHDETYASFPWHIEPTLTLDQLYDARARELRERYDYLLLSYSGGADSHNMVQAFARQNLHIDEIITNHMTEATKGSMIIDPNYRAGWNFNAEHELNAMPRLKELREQLPRTKFTVIDVSDVVLSSLQAFDDVHWVLDRAVQFSVGQTFRYNMFMFGDIKKRLDKGLRAAIVVGIDKPKTMIDADGVFKLVFADGVTNIVSVAEFNNDYSNLRTELFYWSDTTCALVAKQAHLIYNWVKHDQKRIDIWKRCGADMRYRVVIEPLLREMLYTTWQPDWFQTQKATTLIKTEYDEWFHKQPSFHRQQLLWRRGLDYLEKIIPDYITKNDKGEVIAVRGFQHEYVIGTIQPE